MKKLFEFREEYKTGELNEAEAKTNPLEQFQLWLQAAIDSKVPEPNAMIIATCTARGKPSARVVLLKETNKNGFVFFTNYLSRKGRELLENPFAALVFDWHTIERQVRVEGRVEKLSAIDSDVYFNERPREAQIGAWASPQSKILGSREELKQRQASRDVPVACTTGLYTSGLKRAGRCAGWPRNANFPRFKTFQNKS